MISPPVAGVVHGVFRALEVDPGGKEKLAYERAFFSLNNESIALSEQGDFPQQKWPRFIALSQSQRQPYRTAIGLFQIQAGLL